MIEFVYYPFINSAYECMECGSFVADTQKHSDWHEKQDKALYNAREFVTTHAHHLLTESRCTINDVRKAMGLEELKEDSNETTSQD